MMSKRRQHRSRCTSDSTSDVVIAAGRLIVVPHKLSYKQCCEHRMFWAFWAHRCRLFPAAVSQWSEMVVKGTGPQDNWKMRFSLSSLRKRNLLLLNTMPTHRLQQNLSISVTFFLFKDYDILEMPPQVNINYSVSQHPQYQLAEKFGQYFFHHPRKGHLSLDPFSVHPTANYVALPSHPESQLLEVSTDCTLKLQWGKLDVGSYWITVSKECPCQQWGLWNSFSRSWRHAYLFESGLSIVTATKTKARNRFREMLEATRRLSFPPIQHRLASMQSYVIRR